MGAYMFQSFLKKHRAIAEQRQAARVIADAHKEARDIVGHASLEAERITSEARDEMQKLLGNLQNEISRDAEAGRALHFAHEEAREVVRRAAERAETIVEDMKGVAEQLEQDLTKQGTQKIDEISAHYSAALAQAAQTAEHDAGKSAEVFAQNLHERVAAIDEKISEQVERIRNDFNASLQQASKKRISQLEEMLNDRLPDIAKRVISRSISLADHERLVREELANIEREKPWL